MHNKPLGKLSLAVVGIAIALAVACGGHDASGPGEAPGTVSQAVASCTLQTILDVADTVDGGSPPTEMLTFDYASPVVIPSYIDLTSTPRTAGVGRLFFFNQQGQYTVSCEYDYRGDLTECSDNAQAGATETAWGVGSPPTPRVSNTEQSP
jgi:hypothetical protein